MRKRLLFLAILVLLTSNILAVLNLNITSVSAGEYPAIYVDPPSVTDVTPGNNFTVSICTDYAGDDVWGWQFTLYYDPYVLHGVNVTNGDLIEDPTRFIPGEFDNEAGALSLTGNFFFFITEPAPTTSGPGILANVTFTVVGKGSTNITIGDETQLKGYTEDGYGDPYTIIDASEPPGATEPPYGSDHIQHGYVFNAATYELDVAVISVVPSLSEAYQTWIISVNVTVRNVGYRTASFNVTAYYDGNPIDTLNVIDLAPNDEKEWRCSWDLSGVAYGEYATNATAVLTGDMDTSDNFLPGGTVKVRLMGDVDGDDDVDIIDVGKVAMTFAKGTYNVMHDVDRDGDVDIIDVGKVAMAFAKGA